MSIVVLKRKSRRWKVPISGIDEYGFSLNGTLRNIGVVGKTNLARSVSRTPFRGTEPIGHGGCCGTYPKIISNSGSCCSNDNRVVKRSVMNNRGLTNQTLEFGRAVIQAAPGFEGIGLDLERCPCPNNRISKSPLWQTQNEYIIYNIIAKNAGFCGNTKVLTDFSGSQRPCGGSNLKGVSGNTCQSTTPGSNFIGTRRLTNKCTIAKPDRGGIDMSIYLKGLIYKRNCLPQINSLPYLKFNRMPDPPWLNNSSCAQNLKSKKIKISNQNDSISTISDKFLNIISQIPDINDINQLNLNKFIKFIEVNSSSIKIDLINDTLDDVCIEHENTNIQYCLENMNSGKQLPTNLLIIVAYIDNQNITIHSDVNKIETIFLARTDLSSISDLLLYQNLFEQASATWFFIQNINLHIFFYLSIN